MEQRTRKPEYSHQSVTRSHADTTYSNANADDANIFDAVIGKQFFQVVLHNGQHHPVKS